MRDDTLFPPELLHDMPRITLSGRERLQVEQHKGIHAYQEDEVTLVTGIGLIRIKGKEMCIQQYTASEAVICGQIVMICIGEEAGCGG